MDTLWVVQHSWLIPLLPLIGAAIAGLFGAKWLKGLSHWPIWLGVGASAVLAIALLFQTLGLAHHESTPSGERPSASHEAHGESHAISATKVWFSWIEVGDSKF